MNGSTIKVIPCSEGCADEFGDWSNDREATHGDGRMHGLFSHDVKDVTKTFTIPEGVTNVEINLRVWLIDTWDGGDYLSINLDGEEVYRQIRNSCCDSGCAPISFFPGEMPTPHSGGYDPKCYEDVVLTKSVRPGSSLEVTVHGQINEGPSNETWAFNRFVIFYS